MQLSRSCIEAEGDWSVRELKMTEFTLWPVGNSDEAGGTRVLGDNFDQPDL